VEAALAGRDYEIVIVDDGSTDRTAEILAARMGASGGRLRHIRHDRSAGQSAAVRSGVWHAAKDIVVTMDGDGQNDPAYLPKLADALMAQMQGGVLRQSADPLANPPEAARSRLPGLQSRIGEGRREMADSIGSLIDLLARRGAGDRIGGAIQGAPAHIRTFVDRMGAAAELASRRSGVPAKLILSQAALESGWGEREIRRPDGRSSHNLFGIKAGGGWRGEVVNVMTTEYDEGGVAHRVSQPFRAYGSYAESFQDYAALIGGSDRYGKVVAAPSAEAAARRIQEAGYATDPGYADKLISIMGYFNAR
jgi:flagellar protein FlgJ